MSAVRLSGFWRIASINMWHLPGWFYANLLEIIELIIDPAQF